VVVGRGKSAFLYSTNALLVSGAIVASGVCGCRVTIALVGFRTRQNVDLPTTVRAKLICRSGKDGNGPSKQGH